MFEKDAKLKSSKAFLRLGTQLKPFFAHLKVDLIQAKIQLTVEEHIAESLHSATNMALLAAFGIIAVGVSSKNSELTELGFLVAPVVFLFMLYSALYLPKVKAMRRAKEIDRELPYALRHLLIEVKSGIPLYRGLVAISEKYGAASDEVKLIVEEINAGKSEIEAIEESIFKNPSLFFRRAFWQILNALKTGTDIETTLDSTVSDILKQQMLAIKKYGQELNPMTLMYMMVAVIMPSLGITFLMILSTFTGGDFGNSIFIMLLTGLVIFQSFFITMVKRKRPLVKA